MARFIVTIEGTGEFPLRDRELAIRCFEHYSTTSIEGIEYPNARNVVLKDTETGKVIREHQGIKNVKPSEHKGEA